MNIMTLYDIYIYIYCILYIFVSEKGHWVILYILRKQTTHISVLQKRISRLNTEHENRGCEEHMNFDLYHVYQSHVFVKK